MNYREKAKVLSETNIITEIFDDIDISIIKIVQENPNITRNQIAERLNRSQPAIGSRWNKLMKMGFLKFHYGMDITKLNKIMVKVDVRTNYFDELETSIRDCPYLIYFFRQTGNYNICVFLIGSSLKKIFETISYHFKGMKIHVQIITKSNYDIFPIRFMNKCECQENGMVK